ncbi:uncharacterized protein QC761_100750 [Podospora bellae-mahoneyi]|uniref:Uncharacterized protein n=1 Tax=Podospora bellae-mahoneyi TaxID=2093777 RepID=A0ABR0FVB1_9PEZI|nr:hypothetical protein QC761_100750 [Podospora bellae-mahoneyi]
MHISRTVLTTIAIAATGSALPASSCGNGNCPHNGGNTRISSGNDQGAQQGQQGQQGRFDKTRQNGNGGLSTRSHDLMFAAGHGADSGNQMGGSNTGNNGLYDKSGDYLGKKELNHESLQLSTTSGGSNIPFTKEQQYQPRSEVNSGLHKNNNGQQQQQHQQQAQENGQLMTTLDKIRELLFGPQQQQNLERQQEGKGKTQVRRSEVQGQQQQGPMGSGALGNAGRFESNTYPQNSLEQERQRLRNGQLEQPLGNNVNKDEGLTQGQNQRINLDNGNQGQLSTNGQLQSAIKGGEHQNPAMKEQDVPTIVISQHEKVQPRGQGQSSSKGSSASTNNEGDSESTKFVQPAQMKTYNQEDTPMQQKLEKGISSSQLLNKGENNNQGRLSGRAEHQNTNSGMTNGQDAKAEKVLGSSDQGQQWGQIQDELKKCLYVAGQQGDINMLRDCFNNDADKMSGSLQGQQGQQGQQQQRFDSNNSGQNQGQQGQQQQRFDSNNSGQNQGQQGQQQQRFDSNNSGQNQGQLQGNKVQA